jgi:hypothetical protein
MQHRFVPAGVFIIVFAPLALSQTGTVPRGIFEPVFNRNAFYVNLPANWQFEGTILPGPACEVNPLAVFRASSPDGLTGVYQLPRTDWAWSSDPRQAGVAAGCLPLNRMISAHDYLVSLLPILRVNFVKEEDPSVMAAEIKRNLDASNAKAPPNIRHSGDISRFVVRYELNGHPIDEVIEATIGCMDTFYRMMNSHGYKCDAWVTRMRAPAGKFAEAAAIFKGMQPRFDPQWNSMWMAAWAQKMREDMNRLYSAQTKSLLAAGEAAGQARMLQHQQFMASFQRQADVRNSNFAQSQVNKQRASDNFVDYILDCTRLSNHVSVSGPNGSCQDRQSAPYPR